MSKIKHVDSFTFLRAVLIIAISIFHASIHSLKGGFMAVNSFFVLSGFLMMSKLEIFRDNNLSSYLVYIKKRLKTLLPALYFVLVVSLVFSLIFSKTIFHDSIKSSIPTALNFQNIYQILIGGSYFKQNGFFSMFTHFWYISIQIQFTVIFTLINYLVINLKIRNRILIFCLISLVSMFLMIYFSYDEANISRIYYGTDTRIYAFFLGAIAYLISKEFPEISEILKNKKELSYILLGATLFFTFLAYFMIDGNKIFTYRIIMPIYTVLQAILVYFLYSFEKSNLFVINKRSFSVFKSIFYYLGLRSYYIYIWQYIVNTFISYYLASLKTSIIFFHILQVIIVLVFSELTYLIFNRKNIKKSFYLLTLALLFILNIIGHFLDNPKDKDMKKLERIIRDNKKQIIEKNKDFENNKGKKDEDKISNTKDKNSSSYEQLKAKDYDDFNFTDFEKSFLYSKSITAIGDSVLINIDSYLREYHPNLYLDGEVGRNMIEGPDILKSIKNNTGLGDIVLIALGSNGQLEYQNLIDLEIISDGRKIFFVNSINSQSWEKDINKDIEKFCNENKNAYLVDWYKYAKERPDLFAKDFVHPNIEGSIAYRNLIERAILNAYSK